MQLKVLVLENLDRLAREISDKISQHMNNMNDVDDEDEREQRRINRLISNQDDDEDESKRIPFNYVVDTAQYYKVSDFFFRKDSCTSVYISTMMYEGNKTMVVVVDGMDYTAIYDEKAYQELVEQFKD